MDKNIRDARINRMSEAFTRLRIVADILCEKADEEFVDDLIKKLKHANMHLSDFIITDGKSLFSFRREYG